MKACILSVSGPDLTAEEAAFLSEAKPWAIIVMGRSCVSKVQLKKLVEDIWEAIGRKCLIFIDQEGGRVARLKAPEWPVFPPADTYHKLYQADQDTGIEACRLGHTLMGLELSSLGIHADCSPVVDLTIPGAHDIIGDRAFGADAETVGILTNAALEGLTDAGVAGVIKHIPGHGRAKADSHEELPVVADGEAELAEDLQAFGAIKQAPMAMTAHILYPAFDTKEPATTSEYVISHVIRERIGFDGLLMSDDLGMKALGGPLSERAQRALKAGCDVVLHCAGFEKDRSVILDEMIEVANATPELTGKALERALSAEKASTHRKEFDVAAMQSRYDELMSQERVNV
ncbi:MAG: beta-N-acetylhexosaminidase [Ponticaulis sp.]|nr:beta-N-acetylhexosaminidase [Ponticaulis sp.]|tara:strand:+ start:1777 stop:2811 length:1035 start_codon:yes stop_codon:yes gene_type:complete